MCPELPRVSYMNPTWSELSQSSHLHRHRQSIPHEDLPCSEPCREQLVCGHGCQNLCGQKCFCDCKTFEEVTRQAHTVAKQGIEQKLIQMGAERTKMLLASQNNRNVSRQPPTTLPAAQTKRPQKGRVGAVQQPRPTTAAQVAETAAQWGRYVENIDQHDEMLRLEHKASLETRDNRSSKTVIRDVYRPTSLVNGQRAGTGSKVVHNVQLTYSQVAAAASTNGQPAQISNGPGHTQGDPPSNISAAANGCSHSAENGQLGQPGRGGGKGSQKKVAENGGRNETVSVQQLVQETPVQQHLTHFGDDVFDLLGDLSLNDSTSHADTNGSIGLLAGHEVAPQLLAQFGSMISPPPGFPTHSNNPSTQSAVPTVKSDNEEDWLIEF